MRSSRPKPLHLICGRAMVVHVIHALEKLQPTRTAVVVGHQAEAVTKKGHRAPPAWANVAFVEQLEQNGTGDAAAIGMTAFDGDDYDDDATIVILPGDTPLLEAEHARRAGRHPCRQPKRVHPPDQRARRPDRIWPDRPQVVTARSQRIVEQRDASPDELDMSEVCTPASCVSAATCSDRRCATLTTDNAQGEYYLTDVVAALAGMGHRVGCGAGSLPPRRRASTTGGSSRSPSASCAARTNRHWLLNGVTMLDPAPDLHRRERHHRPRRHAVPRHHPCKARPSVGDGCELGPGAHASSDCAQSAPAPRSLNTAVGH